MWQRPVVEVFNVAGWMKSLFFPDSQRQEEGVPFSHREEVCTCTCRCPYSETSHLAGAKPSQSITVVLTVNPVYLLA